MKFSGFLNVYLMDDMSWKYVFGEKSHTASNLKDLEFLVRMHGLKWSILDEELAHKSVEEDKQSNYTGFLNVYRKDDLWHYRGTGLKSHSLQTLKKNAERQGLEWRQTDRQLAEKNWKLDVRKYSR
ncbi:hypothetical protein [Methanobrevibacter sp.]|uniref:hypothetical protein n=1 Tax=Methanobrevibacter sp. TaxID=66852 RepID=UPI0025E2E1F2|nr:hypothetical protein [Methanobrevibacter sp.]MBQ2831118.1 hypothetical protein [Methanobrevibacter sp.]